MNSVKVFVLMAGMTALFMAIGGAVGGQAGALMALLFAGAMNVFMYWNSGAMVLRAYGARVVTPAEAPELHAMVDRLRQRAGLPMPTVAVAPHAQPNAFATGRDPEHAVVCVTEGIVQLVSREELEGVIAHELAHIKNRDILVSSVAAMIAGAISAVANVLQFSLLFGGGGDEEDSPLGMVGAIAMMILAPIAAMLVQLGISRQREYLADATAARIMGTPDPLADALLSLERGTEQIPLEGHVNPSSAPLYIVNPLSGGGVARLFSTHPPIEERVRRLRGMRV